MRHKVQIIIVLIWGLNIFVNAQENYDNPILSTPEADSFKKFIDNNVNLYNGSVDVSVPVYTITDGEIQIPITLRYSTSGIKVNEEATWVGLGWNLNVGGMITRTVIGASDIFYTSEAYNDNFFPDDNYSPYKNFNGDIFANSLGEGAEVDVTVAVDDFQYTKNACDGHYQPDVYYYNFLGYSGKFYLHPVTKEIILENESPWIKFERFHSPESPAPHFAYKATSADGVSYIFEELSKVESYFSDYQDTENYHLTTVIYPNSTKIDFEYNDFGTAQKPTTYSQNYINKRNGVTDPSSTLYPASYQVKYLFQIVTPNLIVRFNTTDERLDLPGERRLTSIDVIDKETNVKKTFEFSYSYFLSNIQGNYIPIHTFDLEALRRRLKLTSFGEKNLPKYTFQYIGNLPLKNSYAQDYWGYYNGKLTNESLVPDLTYLDELYKYDSEITKTNFLGENTINSVPEYIGTKGYCRAADEELVKSGLLKKIIYPTGGDREINYNSNTFGNYYHPSIQQIERYENEESVVENVSDMNSVSDNTSHQFYVQNPTRVKISGNILRGTGEYADIQDAYIELRYYTELIERWTPESIYEGDPSGLYEETTFSFEFDEIIEPRGSYPFSITAYISSELPDQSEFGSKHIHANAEIKIYPTGVESYSRGGGVRVSSEILSSNLPYGSDPVKRIKYDYEDMNTEIPSSNGKLSTPLIFHKVYPEAVYFDLTEGQTGQQTYIVDLNTDYEIGNNNFIPSSYSCGGGNVGYSKVIIHEEIDEEDSNFDIGSTEYEFYNQFDYNQNYLPGSQLTYFPLNGKIKNIYKRNIQNEVVYSKSIDYGPSLPKPHNLWGAHGVSLMGGLPQNVQTIKCEGSFYQIFSYNIPSTTITETFEGELTKQTLIKYNDYSQPYYTSVVNSDEIKTEETFKYPSNYTGSDPIILDMAVKNFHSSVINKKKTVDDVKVYEEDISYLNSKTISLNDPFDDIVLYRPNIKNIALDGTVFNEKIELSYDDRLAQVDDDFNNSTYFLWAYNKSYPVAKIVSSSTTLDISAIQAQVDNIPFTNSDDQADILTDVGNLKTALGDEYTDTNNQVTLYTYAPLIGMTSLTDPSGRTTYYEYDAFGRLQYVRDHNGNIVNKYDYHYAGQE